MQFRKIIATLLVLASGYCYGNDSLPIKDSGLVVIRLQNAYDKLSKIDSVFVIFDRYDLRGAGVVKQVFYPDRENQINISIPKGKYYINIYCLGIYNKECFDRIVTARSNKKRTVPLRLQQSAIYHQGSATMPTDHFDPAHLAILNFSTR